MTTDYCYRFLNDDTENGLLSCGFLSKSSTMDIPKSVANNYYRCSLVLRGKGTLLDKSGVSYPLFPHCLFQHFPKTCYSLLIDPSEEWYEFYISIGKTTFDALVSLNLLHTESPVFAIQMQTYLEQWMVVLLAQLKNTKNVEEVTEIFFNTQKLLICLHKESTKSKQNAENSIIDSVKQLLSHQYHEDLSLENIALSFGMNYEKFRKLFKEKTGVSPLQYRLKSKFLFAQMLLSEGFSITAVASKVGYDDPFIFSKQFKKYMGLSPKCFKIK